jgi:hypothetical protein
MSQSPILPIVFGIALCTAPTIILAQSAQTEIKTVQTPASEVETSLPRDAIAGHIATFNAFVHKQAIAPTIDLTNSSVDLTHKSVRWAWDGSTKSARWIWDGSANSVQWIWDSSTGTLSAVVGGIGNSVGALSDKVTQSPYWPPNAMDQFVEDLHGDAFTEFAELVARTGFAISDVKVGVGIVPDLAVEFKHVRDLTKEEIVAVEKLIKEYTSHATKKVGYIESILLHNLVVAGKYSATTDISSVSVKLFPFPGLVLKFDPFHYTERKANKLKSAFDLATITSVEEDQLEKRLNNIEAEIEKLHAKSNKNTD